MTYDVMKELHLGTQVAVADLCLGVAPGERFGLLGPNGAGKTTTLGMLTGRVRPTSGDARVQGVSVIRGPVSARALLGFCPQQDPLLNALTAYEQLALYAVLKVRNALLRSPKDPSAKHIFMALLN
jgi:ABC-2 type transport system ATP-binding protein